MSSHDTTMRTARALQLKPGTTLRQVFEAMDAFLTRHDLELHPMDDPEDLPSHGEVALNDSKGTVELSVEGELTFMLDALSPSLGIAPDQSDSLLHGIKALLAEGGAIELIDHDASPGNDDDAIIVFFIAPTEPQVRRAQIRYGMDKAAECPEGQSADIIARSRRCRHHTPAPFGPSGPWCWCARRGAIGATPARLCGPVQLSEPRWSGCSDRWPVRRGPAGLLG